MIRNTLVLSTLVVLLSACSDGADGIKGGGDKNKSDATKTETPAATTEEKTNAKEPNEIAAGIESGKSKLSERDGDVTQVHTADESLAGCSGLPKPYAATFSTKEDGKAKVDVQTEGATLVGWTAAGGGDGGGSEFGPVRGTKPGDCPALKEFLNANKDAQYVVQINVDRDGVAQSYYGVYGETNAGVRGNHAACLQQAASLRGNGVEAFCVQVRGKGDDVKL